MKNKNNKLILAYKASISGARSESSFTYGCISPPTITGLGNELSNSLRDIGQVTGINIVINNQEYFEGYEYHTLEANGKVPGNKPRCDITADLAIMLALELNRYSNPNIENAISKIFKTNHTLAGANVFIQEAFFHRVFDGANGKDIALGIKKFLSYEGSCAVKDLVAEKNAFPNPLERNDSFKDIDTICNTWVKVSSERGGDDKLVTTYKPKYPGVIPLHNGYKGLTSKPTDDIKGCRDGVGRAVIAVERYCLGKLQKVCEIEDVEDIFWSTKYVGTNDDGFYCNMLKEDLK